MKYDLKEVRKKYGFSMHEMSKFIGIMPTYYSRYEEEGDIPSKYIYILWLKISDFPIPDDFFWYTSFTLMVNMKYHKMTQSEIAEMFDIRSQSTICSLFKNNIPMYELKEYFNKFDPLIIPLKVPKERINNNLIEYGQPIQDLTGRGNFISAAKKRKTKLEKQKIKMNIVD